MLSFDPQRYLRIQSGALALTPRLREAIAASLTEGRRNIFFLGTGGAAILMMPAAQLLQRRSGFPTFLESSAELVLTGHQALGPQSIVIIPSLSGTTRESIAALEYCRGRGAKVFTLVGHAETPLGTAADQTFVNFAEDDTSSESFYLQSLAIALAIMDARQEIADYRALVDQLHRLPQLLVEVKRRFEPAAEQIAERWKDETYHIVTGAGPTWPEAFYYGMCILEEMQWVRTRPVHASDFFHGTLELVEKNVSVLLCKGEDETRPLAERVEAFVGALTDRLQILDTADIDLPGISQQLRALISPVILAALLERVSAHLEVKRNHPLVTRRYYRRVAY
jgi:fructoselysine-6-phosphate deglycase